MATNDLLLLKRNASGGWEESVISPVAGKILGFTDAGAPGVVTDATLTSLLLGDEDNYLSINDAGIAIHDEDDVAFLTIAANGISYNAGGDPLFTFDGSGIVTCQGLQINGQPLIGTNYGLNGPDNFGTDGNGLGIIRDSDQTVLAFFAEDGTLSLGSWAISGDVLSDSAGLLETANVLLSQGIGIFGITPPETIPATPITLLDVIALLQSYGFCS